MEDSSSADLSKEKLKLVLQEHLDKISSEPVAPVDDGWHVMKDPGECFGGLWPVGVFSGTLDEMSDIIHKHPWIAGAKASGASKGKVSLTWGVRDPQNREWTFTTVAKFDVLKNQNNPQTVEFTIYSTADVIEVGQWLANRLKRPVNVQAILDDGSRHRATSTFYNSTVSPQASPDNSE